MNKKINISQKKRFLFMFFLGLGGIIFSYFSYQAFFRDHSKDVPSEGGILTESTIGQIKNLNPLAREQSDVDRDIQALIFEGLLRYDPLTNKVVEGLAHMQVKNPSTYHLTLKDNLFFHDGSRLTMEDVLFTFESVIKNPHFNNNVLYEAFQYIEINVLDERTIEFRLIEPNFFFPYLLTTPILPQKEFENAFIEQVTDSQYVFNKSPIAAGPYKLENIVPNEDGSVRIFLKKHKKYYNDSAKVEQIVFHIYPDIKKLLSSSQKTHLYSRLSFEEKREIEKIIDLEFYTEKEYTLPRFSGIFFNLDRSLMNRPVIRKSLSLAFDKSFVLKNEPQWKEHDAFFFFEDMTFLHKTDFSEARSALRDGGYPYNEDLSLRTQGNTEKPLSLNLITSTSPPAYSRFAQSAKQVWERELSLKINLEILNPEDFQKRLVNRDYDMVLFGINYSQNIDSLSTWHSSQSGQYNLSNLTNNTIDFLINEVRITGSQTDLFELNKELNTLQPALIIATPRYFIFSSSRLKNFNETFVEKIREHAQRFSSINKWYFYEKKVWDLPPQSSFLKEYGKWLFQGRTSKETDINPIFEPEDPIDYPLENENPT